MSSCCMVNGTLMADCCMVNGTSMAGCCMVTETSMPGCSIDNGTSIPGCCMGLTGFIDREHDDWLRTRLSGWMCVVLFDMSIAVLSVWQNTETTDSSASEFNIVISHIIGISCLSAKHAALWRKSYDWLARYQNNESAWGNMSVS